MTLEELYRDKPHGEVIIEGGELGKRYKAFVCHGCQICWQAVDSYPHYLSIEELPCPATTGNPSDPQPTSSTSTPTTSTSSASKPAPESDPGTESA
jgi:hypothetical protein